MIRKLTLILIAVAVLLTICSCSEDKKGSEESDSIKDKKEEPVPLNISVFLDLSDRLERPMTPTQMERDTAIIGMLADRFIDHCEEEKILPARDHMKILFHPAPNNPNIVLWASNLEVDLDKLKPTGPGKKKALLSMKDDFYKGLSAIYKETLASKKWLGSDIWDFFSNGKVDVQCVREGYRNVLVILTDGYLYYTPNKIKKGTEYSYILPQTLAIPNASLICKRKGLSNLEVLVLEVNPYTPAQRDRLFEVMGKWFTDMEVGKFYIAETDLPSNIAPYIENFMKE